MEMFVHFTRPVGATSIHSTGTDDLVRELGVTEEEAKFLQSKINEYLDFWYAGDDPNTGKKLTIDGDDVYHDLNFKEFLLAMICDRVCGAHRIGRLEAAKEMENIASLHKHLHFSENRITIKEKYYGWWKNAWKW